MSFAITFSSARELVFDFSAHQFDEAAEMMLRVVRSGRCFRMVLDRDDRQRAMPHSFDALVVEIDMRHFKFRRQSVGAHRETVIV